VVTEEAAKHPDKPVEVWATDEHRIGLKPIIRRVWAPKGQRPIALGHHRYKWLYVTAFVQPISGEVFWYVSNGVSKPFFAALLALFAREAGAGRERILVLGLDNAGWHTAPNLVVPDGIRLVYLPRYSPELQPAEHLWPVLDEPLANQYFETLADLEHVVTERCRVLNGDQLKLDLDTGFGKVVVGQQLTPTDAVVSITRDGSGRRDQAALASRMLGGRAMRAALNSGPMRPVAGVRRVMCRPSLVIATSWSRSRSRSTSPHSGRKPALQQRSSSSLRRMSARKEQNTWPRMAASDEW
jgi:transposase